MSDTFDLDRLEALATIASAGPWTLRDHRPEWGEDDPDTGRIWLGIDSTAPTGTVVEPCGGNENCGPLPLENDAVFIVEARNALPALIAEARQARQLREAVGDLLIGQPSCRYDDHGLCREHGLPDFYTPCPFDRFRAALRGDS